MMERERSEERRVVERERSEERAQLSAQKPLKATFKTSHQLVIVTLTQSLLVSGTQLSAGTSRTSGTRHHIFHHL
jgi:hypothetical protein